MHHTRALDQMIQSCPKSNRGFIGSPSYARRHVEAYIILRDILRGGRVCGVYHVDEMMLGMAKMSLGASSIDGSVHELHK